MRVTYSPRLFDGQGVYCGPSTASEVFLIFTTQLYSYLCNYPVILFIYRQEGSIATGILPTPNTYLSSLPVGSKSGMQDYVRKYWNVQYLCVVLCAILTNFLCICYLPTKFKIYVKIPMKVI